MSIAPLPKHRKQLQNGLATSGEDCGVETVGCALDFASAGSIRLPTKAIRGLMGVPKGSTTARDQMTVLEHRHVTAMLEDDKLQPVSAHLFLGGDFEKEVVQRAEKHQDVWFDFQLAYAVVNNRMPKVSGDKAFRGYHAVGAALRTMVVAESTRYVRVWDPLNDGRRNNIPEGPVMWPLWLLGAAAEDMRVKVASEPDKYSTVGKYYGAGTFVGILVRRSKAIPKPKPTEGEPPTPAEEPDECEARLTAREKELTARFREDTRELLIGIQNGLRDAQMDYDAVVEASIASALKELDS